MLSVDLVYYDYGMFCLLTRWRFLWFVGLSLGEGLLMSWWE